MKLNLHSITDIVIAGDRNLTSGGVIDIRVTNDDGLTFEMTLFMEDKESFDGFVNEARRLSCYRNETSDPKKVEQYIADLPGN